MSVLALGNPLGSPLAKPRLVQAETSTYFRALTDIVTPSVVLPPANARFMRVAAIGAGGLCGALGTSSTGGGGGGCAATKIVRASPVQWRSVSQGAGNGGSAVASFPGYYLVGQGGTLGGLGAGQGGQGSGGDYNFKGGNGINFSSSIYLGGGAAGPNGAGGNGGQPGVFDGSGWGCGGGSGGLGRTVNTTEGAATGGGGAGAIAGSVVSANAVVTSLMTESTDLTNYPFGASSASAHVTASAGSGNTKSGGAGGGGGSGAESNDVFGQGGGGSGLLVIEWFY